MSHEYAARANAYYHRPEDQTVCCDLHDRWHDDSIECPECAYEAAEEAHELALKADA